MPLEFTGSVSGKPGEGCCLKWESSQLCREGDEVHFKQGGSLRRGESTQQIYSFPGAAITNCHRQQKCTASVLEPRSLKSRCWQGRAPSEALERTPTLPPPGFCRLPAILAVLRHQLHRSSLCLCLHVVFSVCVSVSLLRRTTVLEFRAHLSPI